MKSAISPLVAKFSCFNLAVKFSIVNLLYSGVVIYLPWLGTLFSTVVRAVSVAKLLILVILFLISLIIALRPAVAVKLVILGISYFCCYLSITCIFINNIIFNASLNLLKSTGTGIHLSTSNLFTLLFKLCKPNGTFSNLLISNSLTSDFKLAKSVF